MSASIAVSSSLKLSRDGVIIQFMGTRKESFHF